VRLLVIAHPFVSLLLSRASGILILAQNPLLDQVLRLRTMLDLLIEAICAHLLVKGSLVGLDAGCGV
jgi:hypothetical protein